MESVKFQEFGEVVSKLSSESRARVHSPESEMGERGFPKDFMGFKERMIMKIAKKKRGLGCFIERGGGLRLVLFLFGNRSLVKIDSSNDTCN